MNKIAFYALPILLLAIAPAGIVRAQSISNGVIEPLRQDTLAIKTAKELRSFKIEIAETLNQQEQGLMHRPQIQPDYGMLFILPKNETIRMWMKNTPLSLDMLFIDEKGEIVQIAENTTPNSEKIIAANQPVLAVLELLGGTSKTQGIETGNHVIYPHFRP